jgi:hypothetical protein
MDNGLWHRRSHYQYVNDAYVRVAAVFRMRAGTPPKPEPVGVEQMTGGDAASLDANRAAGRGATEHSGRSVGAAVGAKVQQARGAAPPAGDAVEVSMLQVRASKHRDMECSPRHRDIGMQPYQARLWCVHMMLLPLLDYLAIHCACLICTAVWALLNGV